MTTEWSDPAVIATGLAGTASVFATIYAGYASWAKKMGKRSGADNDGIEQETPSQGDSSKVQYAVGVVQNGNNVILVRRSAAENGVLWQFPTGMVNPKRSPAETVVREVEEETGITCRVVREIGRRVHPNTKKFLIYFHCMFESGELENSDKNENADVKWVKATKVCDLITSDLYPPTRDLLRAIDA